MRRVAVSLTAMLACVVLLGCGSESQNGRGKMPSVGASTRWRTTEGKADVGESPPAGDEGAVAESVRRPVASAFAMDAPESEVARELMSPPEPTALPMERRAAEASRRHRVADSDAAERPRDPGPEPRRYRNRHIQSGTLTAGSFDDNERFDDYQQFLSEAMQQDAGETLPRLAIGRRMMVHVRDTQGKPVGDARVVIRPVDPQQRSSNHEEPNAPVLLDLTTASDGRVTFLTGMDAPGGVSEFLVTVYPPKQAKPISRVMQVEQEPWRITLPDTEATLPKRLDLALVIDTTGSMGDELEYLKVEIDSIAKAVYEQFPNVDQRYALVVYRDEGDRYVTRTFDFTGSLAEFRANLSRQSAQGGGNYPEAVHLAMENAGGLEWRDRETARVLFWVADAPPHDRFADRALDAVGRLRERGVRMFPVAASGVALEAEFVMRAGAFLTMGRYLFLTDHSGVGNPHAEPHVPEYQVEPLNQLMIRMIASELTGRRIAAGEVIAVEDGDPTPPRLDDVPQGQQLDYRVSTVRQERSVWPWFPRWAILLAVLVGACVVDSVLTRRRS